MDGSDFDAIVRRTVASVSRRTGLGLVAALGLLGAASPTAAGRRKKRRKKQRKKRRCAAGQVRCNGACVGGDCCTTSDCGTRGDFCTAGNDCTCNNQPPCTGGQVCRAGSTCCIPDGQSDQGDSNECCSKTSEIGTCLCVQAGGFDQFDERNCCSGSSVESVCCIPDGRSDHGDPKKCCSQASPGGICTCRANGQSDADHPATCCSGFSNGNACIALNEPPAVCTRGVAGLVYGVPWVVCRADADSAWLSSTSEGGDPGHRVDPVAACASLGYGSVGRWGGTDFHVCGSAGDSATSCVNPGTEAYTEGQYDPTEYRCGGPGIICNTVIWECLA